MSDPRRQPRPLLGSHTLGWIGAAVAVLAVAAALAAAFRANRASPQAALAANREQQLKLRHEIEAKARQALTQPGRNADGTYRVPIDQVLAMAAKDPRRLDAVREHALKEQAAGK
jgi:flagellar biosynthesis/type III secretory pathway M-ring protein FliF/YscJ